MCRGDIPTNDFVEGLPWLKKSAGWFMMKILEGKYDLEEGYSVAARTIKPELSGPLSVVGGCGFFIFSSGLSDVFQRHLFFSPGN